MEVKTFTIEDITSENTSSFTTNTGSSWVIKLTGCALVHKPTGIEVNSNDRTLTHQSNTLRAKHLLVEQLNIKAKLEAGIYTPYKPRLVFCAELGIWGVAVVSRPLLTTEKMLRTAAKDHANKLNENLVKEENESYN